MDLILHIIRSFKILNLSFRIVIDHELDRIKDRHHTRTFFRAEPPKKYKRLYIGNEVRLMNAYFVTCTGYEADDDGTIRVVHCTYDPETKGGNAPDGRKVKGTIHWVEASNAGKVEVRLYENIVDRRKGKVY